MTLLSPLPEATMETTPTSKTTLLDLMVLLPQLHPTYLLQHRVSNIRDLRLVSKEMSILALTAVTSAEVHLGQGGFSPDPRQLVRLMAGTQLQSLKVTVTVVSDLSNCSVAKQKSSCISGMNSLLKGMGQALSSVRQLSLIQCIPQMVCPQPSGSATSQRSQLVYQMWQQGHLAELVKIQRRLFPDQDAQAAICIMNSFPRDDETGNFYLPSWATCPKKLGTVSAAGFAILATALPNLQKMHLAGCCWDAALPAFGLHCPLITTLRVEAPSVPTQALNFFGLHLPNITSLTISSDNDHKYADQQLDEYVSAVLVETRRCSKLTKLCIDLENYVFLSCHPSSWNALPTGLQHFSCSCSFGETNPPLERFLRRIPSLSLTAHPFKDLDDLFDNFPVLTTLKITSTDSTLTLVCSPRDPDILRLKEFLLSGKVDFSCPSLAFVGTCKDVRDMLAWFPPLLDTWQVSFVLQGGRSRKSACFTRLLHVFPKLLTLELQGEEWHADNWGANLGFLGVLQGSQLRKLDLHCPQLYLTKSRLVQLCSGIPQLNHLSILASGGAQQLQAKLLAEFQQLGRHIDIEVHHEQ